ncbi:MAG: hypothetical protein R3E53_18690 [Myxococcota bacterium]
MDPGQGELGEVEIEELRRVVHVGDVALEVEAPAVVLAGELTAAAGGLAVEVVAPDELVAAMRAGVVEGADVVVETARDGAETPRKSGSFVK